jgi:hypothetical protein
MKKSRSHLVGTKLPEQTHSLPLEERRAMGKALRTGSPRRAHGQWVPVRDRADPLQLLIENSAGRVENLLPLRYGRMLANPFAFYRGAAAVMACDLSFTPSCGL